MGAYLSEPSTAKISHDAENEYMIAGYSSMQGWRISQEDAHNCILNFDDQTAIFAVYDGHGGAEVAILTAERLPNFIKDQQAYKDGDLEQALKDAFLGFDAALLEEEAAKMLKQLADTQNPGKNSELSEEEEDEEDLAELCQEGALPIEQVLEKYKGCAARFPQLNRVKTEEGPSGSGSGSSKPLSPFLRGRRNPVVEVLGGSTDGASSSSQSVGPADEMDTDNEVSSSSCKRDIAVTKAGDSSSKIPESSDIDGSLPVSQAPDASPKILTKRRVQNGDISSCQEGTEGPKQPAGKHEAVSSSSNAAATGALIEVSSNHENGEVSSLSPSSSSPLSASPSKIKQSGSSSNISSSTNENKDGKTAGPAVPDDETSSSTSDDDADFHAEENSSTEDGDEDGDQGDEETDDENEEEETEDEECETDNNFFSNITEEPGKDSGCTAVVVLLRGRDLFVANAGDSRCVVCRKGVAVEMSLDHKPEDEDECDRIYKAGGKVTLDGRVNGGLNLSRAIGDHAYKMNKDLPPEKQMITALPDVRKLIISPDDEFFIIACDGIWNYMSSDDVVEFVRKRISDGEECMSKICEELFDNCLAPHTMGDGTGCDNMTAVIVRFKPTILELPTKITAESPAVATVSSSKRRCASPTATTEDGYSTENLSKRLKTDNDDCSGKECDSASAEANTSQPSTNAI